MKKLFFLILFIIPSVYFSQKNGYTKKSSVKGEVYGAVIDSISNDPMEYVTVALYNSKDNSVVTGISTNSKGKYNLTGIKQGSYYLKLSFVGYQDKVIKNIIISESKTIYNIKTSKLSGAMDLKEVVIKGDVPTVTYEIDKKVVNVEDMNTTIGQSAVEVLENTPSVQVNNDGDVMLRGSSSFTLLIDGIPTAMDANDALKTIPASTIKNIEIITNPAAREQAEGAGGIINIITKKNKLEGASLLANVSGGNFDRYGGDLALSYKAKKHSFNLNGSYNKRNHIKSTEETRTTSYESTTSQVIKNGVNSWEHAGYRVGLDWTYAPNSSHTLSIGSKVGGRLMTPFDNSTYQEYDNNVLISQYYNEEFDDINLKSLSNSIYYRYNINRNDKNYVSFKGIYNLRTIDEYSYANFYNSSGEKTGGNYATEFGPSNVMRLDLDYVQPLKNNMTLEAGLQAQFGLSKDDKDNFQFDTLTQSNVLLPLFSTDVQYNRNIHSAYSLIKGKKNKLGYQIGLRAEYTFRKIEANNAETPTEDINRIDLFPSAHFSYKLSDKQELLASFSRRIRRPRAYFFEPFITWESQYSIRKGNSNLKPEYISSVEVSWIKQIEKKGSVSVEVYSKFLTNLINRIPSVYDTNIILTSPENVGNSTSIGIEPSFIYSITDWWNSNLGGNIYYFGINSVIASNEGKSESYNWNARWRNTFSFKKTWRLQIVAGYNSKTVTALGTLDANYGFDASLRKTFSKSKYSVNFQVIDIFSTRRNIFTSNINNVEVYEYGNPFSPKFMLTLSVKLNNYQKVYNKQRELDDF